MKKDKLTLKINPKELKIVIALVGHKGKFLTTNEIAEQTKMSWRTTSDTLNIMFRDGFVKKKIAEDGKIARWTLV